MAMDVRDLKGRLELLKADRSNLDSTFRQVEKWVGHLSGGVLPDQQAGEAGVEWERAEVWDFTAADGADKLQNNLYSGLTNPAERWVRAAYLKKDLQNDADATVALDDSVDVLFAELAASDFYDQVGAFFGDLPRFGTGIFVGEPKVDALTAAQWKGLDCTAVPPGEGYFELDSAGTVFRFWRVLSWTAVKILSKFKPETVPERIREMATRPEGSTTRHEVAYSVWVRTERMGLPKQFPLAAELRPIGAGYFLVESAEQLGEETGYYEMPVYVVPWQTASGSDWGYCPGIRCLPSVRYLNTLMEYDRLAREKALDPPTMVTETGLLSDIDHTPGAKITVRDLEGSMKTFESGAHFDVADTTIRDLREMIRQLFMVDDLMLKESPAMTAQEVRARRELMNKLFGPTLAAIASKFLDPFIKNLFAMLHRAGRLPKLPEAVVTSGGEYVLEYQGPLFRAQRIEEVAAIERLGSVVAGHVKMGFTKAALVYDEVAAIREIAKRLGTPAVVLRSERQVTKMAKEQEQLQARMMKAEADRAEGEAIEQGADAAASAGAVQPVPANPVPVVTPEMGGGLM